MSAASNGARVGGWLAFLESCLFWAALLRRSEHLGLGQGLPKWFGCVGGRLCVEGRFVCAHRQVA